MILVVEDDLTLQQSLSTVLREEGYIVHAVTDGEEALEYLRLGSPPSLILLDLMLPRMDGKTLRVRLLANEKLARVPVVIVSANPNVAAIARELGAIDFVSKPLSIDELLLVVQNSSRTVTRVEHNLRGAFRRPVG